jgi:hypothetical protein
MILYFYISGFVFFLMMLLYSLLTSQKELDDNFWYKNTVSRVFFNQGLLVGILLGLLLSLLQYLL